MPTLHALAQLGQSAWLDFIRRSLIDSGELHSLVEQGLRGMTSNPTIFEKAIAGSADYDVALRQLVQAGKSVYEIYEALALDDIRSAADALLPVYQETDGLDGYVSMEVNPTLAYDTQATILEARRLFQTLGRPNIMIKIPATAQGLPAIQAVLGSGVNVNVTLIFSVRQYQAVVEAFMAGLEKLSAAGGDLRRIASVASFFVSRIDTAVDGELQKRGDTSLLGKAAVANAKLAYACFKELFQSSRWEKLAAQGARVQRPLWASTGTKNPAYSDVLYVDTLIGTHTVNTMPPATLKAFQEHGTAASTIESDLEESRRQITRLTGLGIDFEAVTDKLLADGVAAFSNSFESLLSSVSSKRQALLSDIQPFTASHLQEETRSALSTMEADRVIPRIWVHDHTVWKHTPTEITNRLEWLHVIEMMKEDLPRLIALAAEVRQAGYTRAVLLGMGGSSLAPEVLRKVFGVRPGFLDLSILDSTDPGAVLALSQSLDPAKTLFIVSTKSGGTVETFSFFKYFYNWVAQALGEEQTGAHFIAITDPGSALEQIARQYGFRLCLLNDPHIGGRYSALSCFGLAPAALIGLDLELLLERAGAMASRCEKSAGLADGSNPGASLGAVIAQAALFGRDKLTLVTSPAICSFGDWTEQLIAESTGKEGKGILPVVGEPLGSAEEYSPDRLFVYLRLQDDHTHDSALAALEHAGHPVVRLEMNDLHDLGAQFFLWEMATAVAGHMLGVNPFDQPNVEAAKLLARRVVASFQKEGRLQQPQPQLKDQEISCFADFQVSTLAEALQAFLSSSGSGAYIAIQAYLPLSDETDAALLTLKTRLRRRTRLAVTSGYGPRFLHSTGQLHKGDSGKGLFIQITSSSPQDAAIPDQAGSPASSMSFSVLETAQALGDYQALQNAGRRTIRFHIESSPLVGLTRLARALKN